MVREGEVAPDFLLEAHDGTVVKLRGLIGKKKIVLYFYIRDNTPACKGDMWLQRDV